MSTKSTLIAVCVIGALAILWSPTKTSNAQRPDAPTYAQRGPYAVGTQALQISDDERPLDATIWYPTESEDGPYTYRYPVFEAVMIEYDGQAVENGAILSGDDPYPLVVFSHGSGGYRLQSLYLTEHLASYGFVVIAADHVGNTVLDTTDLNNLSENFAQRPLDIMRQIEFLLAKNNSGFGGMIDLERVAVVGHSFGGYTALASAGALVNTSTLSEALQLVGSDDSLIADIAAARSMTEVPTGLWPSTAVPNVQAVVGLAPAFAVAFGDDGLAAIDVPTMLVVGSADQLTPPENEARVVYNAVSADDRYLAIFDNAGHFIFANQCTPLMVQVNFFYACSDPVWDMERAHDLTNHLTTAFLLAYLQDDAEAMAALEPNAIDFVGVEYLSATSER